MNKNMYLEDILKIHVSAGIRQLDTLIEMEEFLIDICSGTIKYYISHSQTEGQYCTDAKNFIEENYMKDFSISDVADSLNISYQYLSKIFKTQCGRSMSDYLNYIRIEKGKEYLRNTNESFTKIAQKIGYNNVQSFQRFFKKYENVTPYNYRKLNSIR
ncbi:AraC family transcriptional regulator [Anaerocolumna sedimenticola]|uniref:AraC family transcriptional regulator n=1 Tax=Anaerocolumna sedimenticola TaxID=2696063 RepID=A0A6P1TQB3_9FIRM|nr:AraC family transcriptional regulator [Anaerocolumna sedimenticola]QHQ62382.1 AraC family transcriptional regulator [Anaerocolumna sedimenticola]